ncbi:MAG: putative baseplate assembly protein, partial [Deltaproteobacteria bacterium]|nr:putative baseplate assembly protein [Deltaproteobacteria bacterium]
GDFGQQGSYTLDNEAWVYQDERPLCPPAVKYMVFRYREDYRDLRHCLSFNDFRFTDFTDTARTEFDIFQPFEPDVDESPTIYLGFEHKLPNRPQSVYFDLAEELGLAGLPSEGAEVLTDELSRYQAERQAAWEGAQRVVWEYYNGEVWAQLVVEDQTQGFSRSGYVDFVAPDVWESTLKFTEERYWLRARLEMGGYVKSPRIRHLLTNTAPAINATTYRDEVIGSSDQTPLQQFNVLRTPVLASEIIEVREKQRPHDDELKDLGGDDFVRLAEEQDGEVDEYWVRWTRVESFFESGPRDRHYTFDSQSGVVTFGDGRKGLVPPEGRANIVARRYQIGGGSAGNVNPHSLTALSRGIAYIQKVTNPLAATGGADAETVEEAKERAPYTIKSRDRAVTSEDFETLALRASTSLARAKCIESRTHRGAVTLVVIPKGETDDLSRKLTPSPEVLRHVERFLDERRLVGTMLDVVRPRYRDIGLRVFLVRRAVGANDRIRREIERRLRATLHPLVGGRDGRGWRFGRSVIKADLIQVVEQIPGIPGVDDIEMVDVERGVQVEQVRVEDDQLPFLVSFDIVERIRDEVI